jgi:hypothetical protein
MSRLTLRRRNRKRQNKKSSFKLRKRIKNLSCEFTIKTDNTNPPLFQDPFSTISRNILTEPNMNLNTTSPTIENAERDQDSPKNQSENESDQEYQDSQEDQSDQESDQESEFNINNFTFEEPSNQLPRSSTSQFSPYFSNFMEMSFFVWVTKHSICMNIR